MNKVVLIGRLTKDPEFKFTQGNGTAVCTFTLAVDRRFKKEGQQEADFIPIVVWGKQAENTANYMSKGSLLAVSGRIQTRNYDNKEGKKVYITEVVADEVKFLSNKGNNQVADNGQLPNDVTEVSGDDIPFN